MFYLVLTIKYVDYKNIANLLQFIFSIPRKSHESLLLIFLKALHEMSYFSKYSYLNVVTVHELLTS